MKLSYLDNEVKLVNETITEMLVTDNALLNSSLQYLSQSRGKQLRAKLCLVSARCLGATEGDVALASIIELIHLASLVQDDIVDKSEFRRGLPSSWNKFGYALSIYSTDYILLRIMEIEKVRCNDVIAHDIICTVKQMLLGELEQAENYKNLNLSVDDYFSIISKKTGSLFSLACKFGVYSTASTSDKIEKLSRFGMLFGLLFQILDDLIDYYSDFLSHGKPKHNDIKHGIVTLPLIFAVNNNCKCTKTNIEKFWNDKNVNYDFINDCISRHGLYKIKNLVDEMYYEAKEIILSINKSCDSVDYLLWLIEKLRLQIDTMINDNIINY